MQQMLVRRLKTRKYYCYDFHRYISFEDLIVYVQSGCELTVVDPDGKDITKKTLAKMIERIYTEFSKEDLLKLIKKDK